MAKGFKTPSLLASSEQLLAILEAIYQVEGPREAWLDGVLRAATSTMGQDMWAGGVCYTLSDQRAMSVDVMAAVNSPRGWLESGVRAHQDPRLASAIASNYRSTLCARLPEWGAHDDEGRQYALRAIYEPYDVREQTTINGLDCSGKGFCLYFFSRTSTPLTPARRALLSRLATHLSTAYRLQRKLGAAAGVEAVLDPGGKVLHAENEARAVAARDALSSAVRQREHARRPAPGLAKELLQSRRGLVSARWTLVDQYEQDGRRFVLARENAPAPTRLEQLSTRERQVVSLAALGRSNKLIAYELGLAHSTVRVLFTRACAKLGASSRAELLALLNG